LKPKMTNEDVNPRHSKKYSIPSKRTKDDSEYVLKKASFAHKEGRLAEAEKGYLEVLRRKPDWGKQRGRVYTLDKRLLFVKQEGAVKKVTA